MILLVMFLALLALVLLNVPIAVSLGVVAIFAMAATDGITGLPNAALVLYSGTLKFALIAIPLFILAGAIMNASGISRRLINLASALVGFIRGGLAMVTVSASLFFAEISGSAVADVAAGRVACKPYRIELPPGLKDALGELTEEVTTAFPGLRNARWVALRLLEGDPRIVEAVRSGEIADLGRHLSTQPSSDPVHALQEVS